MIFQRSGAVRRGLGLTLIGTALIVVPSVGLNPSSAAPNDDAVTRMRSAADAPITVSNDRATGAVGMVRTSGDLFPADPSALVRTGAEDKAEGYAKKYAAAFGATADQLEAATTTPTAAGYTVDIAQTYQGIPVFGAKLRAQVDKQGDLTSVSGYVAPEIDVATTPKITKIQAITKAIKLAADAPAGGHSHGGVRDDNLNGKAHRHSASSMKATKAELMVYRMGAIQGIEGRNLLAWVVEVTSGADLRETTVLDAVTGKPVNRYSMIAHGLDRELHEQSFDSAPVWKEGDEFPGNLDGDQSSEVKGTGEAYWLFKNTFGRDSYDGKGAKMVTVNNDPGIACPNANWNGRSTNYCSGVSSDDVVAHEWGHAYTEYTSGLLYQWQSGAMNEAYSDIWGQTVDILNDRQNTPDDLGKRTDGNCSKGTRAEISVTVSDPVGSCTGVAAAFGPIITGTVTGDLVIGTDAADTAGPSTTDGCSTFDNAAALAGKFVYVDRGTCPFAAKIDNAEKAGAKGIIFGNNQPALAAVSGQSDLYGAMVSQADGTRIKAATTPLTVSLADAPSSPHDSSFRWLIGEDDPAFGGAIRDMWTPTCYGDPGKVSDEEYFCDTDDNGGVHSNSGVVNHAYALLVDGGTYNGVTVPAIGLDKAANIFWRTQSSYLTPVSGFADLADGLQTSCTDLVGNTTLKKVTLGQSATGGSEVAAPAMSPITKADCDAVAKVSQAVELKVEPVQCNFRKLLRSGGVSCGDGTTTKKVWSEDFEKGLPTDWATDFEAANAHYDPTISTTLPKVSPGGTAHSGGASTLYFNNKGSYGSCQGDAEDYSSRVGAATSAITVPTGTLPRFSFDHYVASEVGFDGGNVKVSVNGGAYTQVPTSAFIYNAPGATLDTTADGNTNPMQGQAAFTGTDGGEPTGSWGTSVIDLLDVAKVGDSVRFRFDFGTDGCNGVDGWYIDNVNVSICEKATAPPVPPTTQPSPVKVNPSAGARDGIVKVRIKVASGATPSGRVLLRIGTRVYTGRVSKGILSVRADSQLARLYRQGVRRTTAIVRYDGDAKVAPFRARVTIRLKGRQ